MIKWFVPKSDSPGFDKAAATIAVQKTAGWLIQPELEKPFAFYVRLG